MGRWLPTAKVVRHLWWIRWQMVGLLHSRESSKCCFGMTHHSNNRRNWKSGVSRKLKPKSLNNKNLLSKGLGMELTESQKHSFQSSNRKIKKLPRNFTNRNLKTKTRSKQKDEKQLKKMLTLTKCLRPRKIWRRTSVSTATVSTVLLSSSTREPWFADTVELFLKSVWSTSRMRRGTSAMSREGLIHLTTESTLHIITPTYRHKVCQLLFLAIIKKLRR